jgi:hypothetical protein
MADLEYLKQELSRERRNLEELTKQDKGVSHLGLGKPPALPVESIQSQESETEEDLPQAVVPQAVVPQAAVHQPVLAKMPPKPGPMMEAQLAPLLALLKNTTPAKQPSAPPPVAKLVAEKYGPVMEQVEDAFDRMEAWGVAVKNWKLWTLLLDQHGMVNACPMPKPRPTTPLEDFRPDLHRALTKRMAKFKSCPVLKCKQSLFTEESTKVMRPWASTNFASALMSLADTLGTLLKSIPRGIPEQQPSAEVTQFLQLPNACEQVYAGTGPVFNAELSRQLSDKIRVETMAAKRVFMDGDLLALKSQTDSNLRTLLRLQSLCNSKSALGLQLDQIHDLQRAVDWHAASHSAYDALNRAFEFVTWV